VPQSLSTDCHLKDPVSLHPLIPFSAMDDLQMLHKRLTKFASGESTDSGAALDVLRTLDKTVMTVGLLKETKIGHTVGKLRKHENEKIANLAKLLVKNWKNMAQSPRQPAALERKTSTVSVASSDGDAPEKPEKKPASKPSLSGPLIPPGLDKVRATVRTKLKETLEASEGGNPTDVAMDIEITMAKHFNVGLANENKKDYSAKFRQLSFNLKKNAPLREDLLQQLVTAEQLIAMSSEELATAEKRNELIKLRDDAFQRARLDWADANEEKINKQCGIADAKGLFTCGRCKSSKTSNTQKQTRSADEPMTVFVQCHNCGNRWKC
jgi:transcription elongation factor S-II